jgi:drug/metabolite transporter (DMT)-like permease
MDTWLIISLIAPALWAITNLIDVYFVASSYDDEYDGAVISGFFQLFPWLLVLIGWQQFHGFGDGSAYLFIGGVCYLLFLFWYFKALFSKNDVALIQLLLNLAVPVTLILSFAFYREFISGLQFVGGLLIFGGVSVLGFQSSFQWSQIKHLAFPMGLAVIFLSLSMIFSSKGYDYGHGFFSSYLIYSLGMMATAAVLLLFKQKKDSAFIGHLVTLTRNYFGIFLVAEFIGLLGYIFSQRSLDLAPSASLVVLVECLLPIFILVFSFFILVFFKITNSHQSLVDEIYRDQLIGYPVKIIATVLVSLGVYVLSLG